MLIGFVGRIGSGKDTASDYLIKKYGFVSLRLSDVIADELMQLNLENTRENKQILGTKMRNEQGEDVWIRKIFDKVKKGKSYIINGIRRPEEANFLKQREGILIRVNCDDKIRFERTKQRDKIDLDEFRLIDSRESERLIDKIKTDFSLSNNGTLESLYSQIDNLIKNITD